MAVAKTSKNRTNDERETIGIIRWSKMDEEIRRTHEKRARNSGKKPSIWKFNPKGGMPKEFADVDSSTFLISRLGQILCSLPRDLLVHICSMLPVRAFLNLSSTCRFLHWRMYTFCTCYVPYTVILNFQDFLLSSADPKNIGILPKLEYVLKEKMLNEEKEDDDDLRDRDLRRQYVSQLVGKRGLLVLQPSCLRKPFFFETLKLELYFPLYYKKYYDRCLVYILAVHGLAHKVSILFTQGYDIQRKPYINFSDTNDFLAAVNATYYENMCQRSINGNDVEGQLLNYDIYINCPYARQMNRVFILCDFRLDVPVLQNNIGIYWTVDSAAIATLKNFFIGSMNLTYHQYLGIRGDPIRGDHFRYRIIEYLFEELGEFEYFYTERATKYTKNSDDDDNCRYIYMKEITAENGGQLRIVIDRGNRELTHVRIGKVEKFEEMDTKYAKHPIYREGTIWWKMETAVEPDEVEEPDEPEKLNEAEESAEAEKPGEAEEEQGASTVCHFCSIL